MQDNVTVDISDVSGDQVSTSRQVMMGDYSSEDYTHHHGLTIDSATEEHDRSSPTDMKALSDHEKVSKRLCYLLKLVNVQLAESAFSRKCIKPNVHMTECAFDRMCIKPNVHLTECAISRMCN